MLLVHSCSRSIKTSLTCTLGSLHRRTMLSHISLNKQEAEICGLLRDYTEYYNENKNAAADSAEDLTLRITGGWVRDKLLGQNSHDLDIAVNIMSGEQFALGLADYLNSHYSKYGIKPHSIHKIDKNPSKSKHLETATTKLFGVEVDFVNLRSEEYTDSSRIPTVEFGTPKEDAFRRDATLNALFYNIQQAKIEDFTGRGLKDLKEGVLRTPLPPKQTFLDDPLRVLRLIRFASRFNFHIEQEALEAMADPKINTAFNTKISRERVGAEMEKILDGKTPLIGLTLIQRTKIDNVIFYWHSDESIIRYNNEYNTDSIKIKTIYNNGILNLHLLCLTKNYQSFKKLLPILQKEIDTNKWFRRNFILSACLIPMEGLSIIWNPKKKVNNLISISESIVKDGLKLSKNEATVVSQTVNSLTAYHSMVQNFTDTAAHSHSRSTIGLFIRSFNGEWVIAHFTSLLKEYLRLSSEKCAEEDIKKLFTSYSNFWTYIHEQNLENCHTMRPLIDGKKMAKVLETKPGPWLGKINEDAIVWQLDHKDGTQAELIQYIKEILPKYI